MKKIILLGMILWVSGFNCLYAQFNEWVDITVEEIGNNYILKNIVFPDGLNSSAIVAGCTRGIITAESKVDGKGTVFYTKNGGINGNSWEKANIIFEGSILGMQPTSDARVYIWGEKGALYTNNSTLFGSWDTVGIPSDIENTDGDIVAAAFASSSVGVVSDGISIWYTINGGDTWFKALYEGKVTINTIIALTSVGNNTFYGIAQGGQLIKSTTSGSDWEVVGLATDESGAPVDLTHLIFKDENNGIISSVKTDGPGNIWRIQDGGVNVSSGLVLDSPVLNFYYAEREDKYLAVKENGEVIKSTDGGLWEVELQKSPDKLVTAFSPATENNVKYVTYDDGTIGIYCPLPEADFIPLPMGDGAAWTFQNTSTGILTYSLWTFKYASRETIGSRHPGYISFYKPGECDITLRVTSNIPGEARDTTYSVTYSVNVELNYDWDLITDIGFQINSNIVFPEGQNLVGFMTGASSTNTSANDYGKIIKTEDGGNTWRVVLENSEELGVKALWELSFPTMEIGYAAGIFNTEEGKDYYIWKTIDGGENWSRLPLNADDFREALPGGQYTGSSGTPNKITAMAFWDENNGLIGSSDRVFRTEDGGETWLPIEFTPRQKVLTTSGYIDIMAVNAASIKYATADTVYAAGGSNANIWRSVDGGNKWEAIYWSYDGGAFRDIAIHEKKAAYVGFMHSDGVMLLTEDGGQTYENIAVTEYEPTLSGGVYLNDTVMLAVGAPSLIAKSIDGGRTWELEGHADGGDACQKVFVTNTGVIHVSSSKYLYHRYIPDMVADFTYSVNKEDLDELEEVEVAFENRSLGFLTNYQWTVNGEEFSTEFNPSVLLKVMVDTDYTVTVKAWNADDPSNFVEKTQVIRIEGGSQVSLVEKDGDFSVYPNPVQELLTAQFCIDQKSEVRVSIVNVSGVEIMSKASNTVDTGIHTWNLEVGTLNKGTYFVKLLINGKLIKTEKIIK